MMNRDRMTRGRTWTNGATTLGIPERLERTLVYPLFLGLVLLPIGWGWLLALAIGLLVFYVEKNRSVRWNALQAVGVVGLGLGLLGSVIWWVMIILAVYLLVMAWFRPNYHLPLVGNLIERWM